MTIVVLGIDALDSKLVDSTNLQLSNSSEITTFSRMKNIPYTLEVWPTVATGKMPNEHGITENGTSSWDNPVVNIASKFTGHLKDSKRNKLGNLAEKYFGAEYTIPETDHKTIFDRDGRAVHNWPGVYRNRYLLDVWRTLNPGEENQSPDKFEREIKGIAAEQFGWIEEMLEHDLSLVGTHIHTIDMAGHIYSEDEERYNQIYKWVDRRVGKILEQMSEEDDLVILSDHGMQVGWIEGDNPGTHSWRAFASTTLDKELFSHVADFKDWIEPEIEDIEEQYSENIEYDEQQLRDLGYIE